MSRNDRNNQLNDPRVPRASGDEPYKGVAIDKETKCSPRERG